MGRSSIGSGAANPIGFQTCMSGWDNLNRTLPFLRTRRSCRAANCGSGSRSSHTDAQPARPKPPATWPASKSTASHHPTITASCRPSSSQIVTMSNIENRHYHPAEVPVRAGTPDAHCASTRTITTKATSIRSMHHRHGLQFDAASCCRPKPDSLKILVPPIPQALEMGACAFWLM